MKFRTLATFTAAVSALLFIAWVFAPEVMLSTWGVIPSEATLLASRRGGTFFAAMAVMFFQVRNLGPSPARNAIVSGFVWACSFVALLGLYELWAGHAGSGILGAVALEIILVLAFAWVGRRERTTSAYSIR